MFRCQNCQKVVPPHTKAQRVVVETRPRRYPKREHVNRFKSAGKLKITDDPGGRGHEIARELLVCSACLAEFRAQRE